jgi:hypothetical protein
MENGRLDKAVPKHLSNTGSLVTNIVFRPVIKIKSSCRLVLHYFETKMIKELNLVEAELNRILT